MPTLDFKGKQYIYAHHLTVPYRPLVPDRTKSVPSSDSPPPPPDDDNLVIQGDNLHALKALLPRYAGRVKCIYIDPPYNTGKEDWVYNDSVNSPQMQEWLEQVAPVDGEDLERHDKWLCMMWPRLHLLRELLSDEGVILVSIDDNEQHHLRMMMDEIFGADNFITCIAVVSNLAGSSDQFGFAGAHEYCLVYAKTRNKVVLGSFEVDEAVIHSEWYKDEVGYYKLEQLQRGSLSYSESLDYPIFVDPDDNFVITDDDKEPTDGGPYTAVYPKVRNKENAIWRWGKDKIHSNPSEIVIGRRKDGSIIIKSKQRTLRGDIPTKKPKTVFYKPEYGSRAGGVTLQDMMPDISFPYPKATMLMYDLLQIAAPNSKDIILDSFAGSGTTAHAVLQLNKDNDDSRQFILVECEEYANEITAERVRRAIAGVPDAENKQISEGLGGSFTYCTLGEPIEIEEMLNGELLPEYSALAAYILYTASGISSNRDLLPKNEDFLFYSDEKTDYYLFYRHSLEWLKSPESMFKEEHAVRIGKYNRSKDRKSIVFAPGKYMGQRFLSNLGIMFCQLPYEIHLPSRKG